MRPVDCPGESRMRENLMSGLGRGSRKRGESYRACSLLHFGCDEVDDGDHLGLAAVAPSTGLGCLDQGVDAFEQAVAQVVGMPGEDALPVLLDQGHEVLDRLQ